MISRALLPARLLLLAAPPPQRATASRSASSPRSFITEQQGHSRRISDREAGLLRLEHRRRRGRYGGTGRGSAGQRDLAERSTTGNSSTRRSSSGRPTPGQGDRPAPISRAYGCLSGQVSEPARSCRISSARACWCSTQVHGQGDQGAGLARCVGIEMGWARLGSFSCWRCSPFAACPAAAGRPSRKRIWRCL